MYFLYVLLVQYTLSVFHCYPIISEDGKMDGKKYMMAGNKQVDCAEPGSTHQLLLPFAVVGLVLYVIGYPAVLGYFFYKKRDLIKEDQVRYKRRLFRGVNWLLRCRMVVDKY